MSDSVSNADCCTFPLEFLTPQIKISQQGIAPSLIVIRVALGVDTHDVISSIAIMASSHTATHSNVLASGDNGSEALLDMSALITPQMREVADLEEGRGRLARASNSLTSHGRSSRSRTSKYALLANEDEGEDENETSRDESPSPGPTPNAQQVEFGGREVMEYPGLKDEDDTSSTVAQEGIGGN